MEQDMKYQEQVKQTILEIVQRFSGLDEVPKTNQKFFDELGFDALDIVECIMEIEEELSDKFDIGVYINSAQSEGIETVGDLIEVFESSIIP